MSESTHFVFPPNEVSTDRGLLSRFTSLCLAVVTGVLLGLLVVGVPNPLLLVAAAFGLVAACVIIARIEWGLLFLVFISYSYFSTTAIDNFGIPSVAKLLVLLLSFGIIVRWALYGERPTGWGVLAFLIFINCLVGGASLAYSADMKEAGKTLVYLIKDSMIAFIVVILLKRGAFLRSVIWALLAAGILMGTLGVYQHLTGTFHNTYWGFAIAVMKDIADGTSDYRISGPLGAPNFFAQILLPLIPLALDRMKSERKVLLKGAAAWALVVCTLSLFFSYSRGGFLALLMMSIAFIILHPPKPKVILILLIIVIPLFNFVPPKYFDRMITIQDMLPGSGQKAMSDDAFRGRKSEMIVAMHMFLDHPIRGVGLGNYEIYYQNYSRKIYLDSRLEGRQAHSRYLEVLAETGLIGFVAFCLLLWMMFLGLWRARKAVAGGEPKDLKNTISAVGIGMVGFLTASIFLHDAFARFFWLMVGISFAIPNIVEAEVKERRAIPGQGHDIPSVDPHPVK